MDGKKQISTSYFHCLRSSDRKKIVVGIIAICVVLSFVLQLLSVFQHIIPIFQNIPGILLEGTKVG